MSYYFHHLKLTFVAIICLITFAIVKNVYIQIIVGGIGLIVFLGLISTLLQIREDGLNKMEKYLNEEKERS
jgi:hypothetical protein